MKKAKKGSYGYIRWEKLRRLLTTLLMLALPLAFFTVGMILNKGDRKSIYTVIAIVGCLPAVSYTHLYLTEFLGGEYGVEGDYPAWEYREDSPLRDLMVRIYEKMYDKKPQVVAIHAGLECGLFYDRLEGLDCVSIGPDMKDIHTSEEKLSISSAARVYEYLLNVLAASK